MRLSHEVLLALTYVSQISDPDLVRIRFFESLKGIHEAFAFTFIEDVPLGTPEDRVLPIATLRSSFGYALLQELPEGSDAELAVFRNAFQFLAIILENRLNTRALESREESLVEDLRKSRDELELRVQERTDQLKTYMAMLEESNQALQDFASIAAHDLQEPLRKVKTFGNMLKQKCCDSIGEQGNSYLQRMLDANQRMQSLLTALLEYSRLSTRAEPFVEVELETIVAEVLSDLEVRIEKTGGEVRVGDLPVIQADPTQMRQLFQNLIGNALKFHKPGEKPIVTVECVSAADGDLQVSVKDNGIGFEERYIDRIFAPFQRLHGKSSLYEGTGMGLAICKKIVERHGGTLTANSSPGNGSTFVVSLRVEKI